jgi:hypothetical protein
MGSGTQDHHAVSRVNIPAHSESSEALLEPLDAAFDRPGANRITLFTKFQILHPPLMVAKAADPGAQVRSYSCPSAHC